MVVAVNDDVPVLDLAINYVLYGCYREEFPKERKRALRERPARLVVERGDVFLQKKERKVS